MTTLNMAWDASVTPEVIGYRVYYGTQSGVYTQSKDVGNVLSTAIQDLQEGQTWYFVVRAYTATDESANSNEISQAVAIPSLGVFLPVVMMPSVQIIKHGSY